MRRLDKWRLVRGDLDPCYTRVGYEIKPLLSIESLPSCATWRSQQGLRVWAEIDLDRIAANVRSLVSRRSRQPPRRRQRQRLRPRRRRRRPQAVEAGAWGLGVVGVEEGEELRRDGIDAPILVLGSTTPVMAPRIVDSGCVPWWALSRSGGVAEAARRGREPRHPSI